MFCICLLCPNLGAAVPLACTLLPAAVISKNVSDLHRAKVSEENQGALGMGARGQGRLTESSGCL